MRFRVAGLDPEPFLPLFEYADAELAARGVQRMRVADKHGAPCRITLEDADVGEEILLLSYEHQPAATAYRQQGPIFVRQVGSRFETINTIPPALARRPLSLRGFDAGGAMVEADLVDGAGAGELVARFFANENVAYIHAHYARRGCFAARIDRAL